jgi:hypothetical protein
MLVPPFLPRLTHPQLSLAGSGWRGAAGGRCGGRGRAVRQGGAAPPLPPVPHGVTLAPSAGHSSPPCACAAGAHLRTQQTSRLSAGAGRGQPVCEERRGHGVAICEDGGGHGEGRGRARLPPGAAAAPGNGSQSSRVMDTCMWSQAVHTHGLTLHAGYQTAGTHSGLVLGRRVHWGLETRTTSGADKH